MPALGHHPQHLEFAVVAEADGTRRGVAAAHVLGEGELGVGVDDVLVEPNDGVLIVVFWVLDVVLRNEDDSGENYAVGGVGVLGLGLLVLLGALVAGDAAADVGGEEEGGEKDEKAEGDGYGVAEAEGSEVIWGGGGRGGHWRRRWWWLEGVLAIGELGVGFFWG